MPRTPARPRSIFRAPYGRWLRWTLRTGLPAAAVALGASWLYRPGTTVQAVLAVVLALAALAVFTATMPGGRSRGPARRTIRDAVVTVADADPGDGTPSDVYELHVFDVSVLVRLREQWNGQRLVPYVHIEHQADHPRLLLVEVDNGGESEHR